MATLESSLSCLTCVTIQWKTKAFIVWYVSYLVWFEPSHNVRVQSYSTSDYASVNPLCLNCVIWQWKSSAFIHWLVSYDNVGVQHLCSDMCHVLSDMCFNNVRVKPLLFYLCHLTMSESSLSCLTCVILQQKRKPLLCDMCNLLSHLCHMTMW